MRTIYCLLVMLCIESKLFGQDKNMAVAGMQVANVQFNNVLNYKTAKSNLKALSKKVVVINFWMTSCGACLKKIPMLDSMRKAHGNELSVLLVSGSKGDTKERVYKAFERIKDNTGNAVGLPVILGDSLLKKQFPHQYVPHFVILDSRLKLLGVSDNEEMTAASLAAVIKTGKVAFTAKQRVQKFDHKRLLFTDESSLAGVMMQSSISRYLPGTPSTSYITKDSNKLVTRILLTNRSIAELLKRACHYFDYPDLIRWGEGLESRMNPAERTGDWVRANSYTYQLVCEPMPYDSARNIMLRDIERVLGYSAVVKDTVGQRYVLKLKQAGRPPAGLLAAAGAEENADVLRLMRYLSRQLKLDVQTKLPNNICTHINLQQVTGKSFAELEALLAEQGFYFTKEPVKKRALFIYQLKN